MSKFQKASLNDVQEQQTVSLSDEFLQALVQELDHEDIIGITLGGSYARGAATRYSDVDLACFWREGLRPPPKRFMYREGKLISIKMTSVTEIREMLKRPQAAIFFASGKHQVLLDKDGSVTRLLAEIEAFRWEALQTAANANISIWMMLLAEHVQKMLNLFQQENAAGLAFVMSKLIAELTVLTAEYYGTLITSDNTYYQQVQEAAGLDSAWTHYHRIATGLEAGPTGIAPLRAQGIAALHLYRETLKFARSVMQAEHLAIAEQVLQVVQSAAERLPFTAEEQHWLKNGG
ncbi:MAG TPA: nucleotidyltransferase domain-containing protein [Ktedonobacteraceae bacterium]|nr:nucleotidyltransferase domain-containing protein [Ktedonobacteraceae bacterium]